MRDTHSTKYLQPGKLLNHSGWRMLSFLMNTCLFVEWGMPTSAWGVG